jgi:mono/diheme cytochrome c family protein
VAVVPALAAAAAPAAETDPGREAYVQYCASCHGSEGRGDGPVAAELKEKPADLTRLGQKYGHPLPRPRLVEFIDGREMVRAHGSREMPVWGRQLIENVPPGAGTEALKRGILLSILAWIESIQER